MKRGMMVAPVLCLVGLTAGCMTMSTETVERVDQRLTGNAGYVIGGEAQRRDADSDEAKTREVSRVDVELWTPKQFWRILAGHPKEEVLYGDLKQPAVEEAEAPRPAPVRAVEPAVSEEVTPPVAAPEPEPEAPADVQPEQDEYGEYGVEDEYIK